LKELPDIAIEINLTSGGVDKLAVYKGLGIPEVLIWENQRLTLYDLRGEAYQEQARSQFFPELAVGMLAQYVRPYDQPQAIKDFLQALQNRSC
jgi:Uma2 family endonuclease